MAFLETQLLTDLLLRKHDCLVKLFELSGQQLGLVASGDIMQLLKVLGLKQQRLAQLQQLDGELEPFRGQQPSERQWASDHDRARSAEIIERSESLFREILAREREAEQLLGQRRDEAAARLDQANAATQVRASYSASFARPAGRLDLSSEVA